MIPRKFLACAGALIIGACAAHTPSVPFEGARYKALTGEKLAAAVVNKQFVFPKPQAGDDVIITSPRCNKFYADGQYMMCGDRVPFIWGTYKVMEDRVCANVMMNARCWKLYRSSVGAYLVEHLSGEGPGTYERVNIEPVSPPHPPVRRDSAPAP
jgi:hypothetical protein